MNHWGWYWGIKNKHVPRRFLNKHFDEIDSFSMYRNELLVGFVLESEDRISLTVPRYNLVARLFDDYSLRVTFDGESYIIPVEKKPCNYGGFYYFFHCPRCDKRMRKLYCIKGQYQCRKCGNVAYYTQRLRPSDRFTSMAIDIKNRIKSRGGNLQADIKPPRMHTSTFQKLKDRIRYYDAKEGQATFRDLRLWMGPKVERWLDGGLEYEWKYDIRRYKKKYMTNK